MDGICQIYASHMHTLIEA